MEKFRIAKYRLMQVTVAVYGVSYLLSPASSRNFEESVLVHSGMALPLLFAIVGSVIAFGGATPPSHPTFIAPLE